MKHTIILFSFALATSISFAQIPNLPGSGNCLSYNGTSDYVDVGAKPIFTPGTQGWTIEAWVKVPVSMSGTGTVVEWYRCGSNPLCSNPDAAAYKLYVSSGGVVSWLRDNNGNEKYLSGGSTINNNIWHHLAFTFNPATEEKYLYTDGILVASDAVIPITSLSNGSVAVPLRIGQKYITGWGTPTDYFLGQLDEVRIWNIARTQTEIRNTMCQKLVGNEAGLMGYWRFDETSGTTAYDSSPYGNHGTLK